jgi:hypothetical protein
VRRGWAVCAAFLFVSTGYGQVRYAAGQNVAPEFDGWEHNADGTYSMVFGYLNRNYEEELDIPVGPNNNLTPGGDRGQPEHFYPRRQRFLFRVVVPADWDKTQKVVWTLTSHGKTDTAKGWLQPEWELSEDVIVENNGGGVPDGLPKPYRRAPSNPDRDSEPRRPRGVQIKWIQYRGPGKVVFDPAASAVVYGQPVEIASKVSFSAPGTYVLRATAFDGQLYTTRDVRVTVKHQ